MNKLFKFCEWLLFILFLVLIFFMKQKLSIIIGLLLVVFLYVFYKKEKIKNYTLFIFVLSLVIRLISIFILKVEITDDFKTMYEASLSLLKGNIDFMNGFYFRTYPFQLGLTLYQALILKIYNNVIILKILNSIYTSLIVVFIYKISSCLFKDKIAKVLSLGYLFYLYPIYLNSVLTNQHIPALLMLIAIYIVVKKEESIKNSIIIALLMGLANFFRSESIIFIIGIVIYYLVFINKNNYKEKIINSICVLGVYFLITFSTSQILMHSSLYSNLDNSVDKNATVWKFYCGLNDKYNGIYNEEDQNIYFSSDNEKELLIDRVKSDYMKFPILFLKKEVILWTQTNYDIRLTNNWNYDIIFFINQGILNIIMILFVVSLYPKKEKENDKILFLKLLIGLYFGIYLFIEISPRYAYNLHMIVFILMGIGVERLFNYLDKRNLIK